MAEQLKLCSCFAGMTFYTNWEAASWADTALLRWAEQVRAQEGDYPSLGRQAAKWQEAYERRIGLKLSEHIPAPSTVEEKCQNENT